MKILTLRLCNLAAFAGEHELDFTRSPLSECGLFAITGPTGSGKSTLLDAMCLALFGSTPRLRQMPGAGTLPQDESVQLRDPRTLLRRGCSHAFAEVTFLGVDDQRYSASWSVRRARNSPNGKIQNSTQVLCRLDPEENVLTDGKQDFNRKLPEVLGLTFDQFTRAVLLAQAEFSAFLKANDNERSALLERLTDSDIYSRISRSAYLKHRDIKQQHAELATLLEQARPSDADERAQLDDEVRQAQIVLKHHQVELLALSEQHGQRSRQRSLVFHYLSQQQRFIELDQQWRQHENEREQCAALDRFTAIRETLKEWHTQQQRHQELKEKDERHTQNVVDARAVMAHQEEDLTRARQHRQQIEAKQQQEAPQLEAALRLEQQYQLDLSRQQTLSKTLTTLNAQHQHSLTQLQQLDDAHRKDHIEYENIARQLHALTTSPPAQRIQSLRQRLNHLDQLRQRWTKRCDIAQQRTDAQQQLDDSHSQLQQANIEHAHCKQQAEQTEHALIQATTHHQQLRDALLAYSEQTLLALRRLLDDDAPCPVCGSCNHTNHTPMPSALIAAQREAAHQQLDPAEHALQKAHQQNDEAQQRCHKAELLLTKATTRSEQIQKEIASLPSSLPPLSDCQQRITALQQRYQRAQHHLECLEKAQLRFQELKEKQQEAEQQRQRIVGAQQQNETQRTEHQQQLETLNGQIQEHQTKLNAQIGDHASAEAWQKAQNTALQQAREQEQSIRDQYDHQRSAVEQAQQTQQQHHNAWLTHCTRLETLSSRIKEWQAAQPEAWQSTEALDTLLAVSPTEHQKLKDALTALETTRHDADISQRTYRQQCDSQLDEAQRAQLETPHALLTTLDEQIATLDEHQQHQQQQVDISQKDYETVRMRQAEDNQRRQRYAELTEQRQQAEQELERWGKISGLIGSADGALFRKMAQQWHLDVLVAHANQHLQTLARRFCLKRGGTELGLMIVDREMGDEERSVHSLSGGETFLVSLALALGLAAMASDRLLIGTLFIDEGFGSLDTRARAMAMDALEALQAQGRQVGIISHVQELHERIPVQVQVCPGGREGSSHLKISSPRSLLDLG